MEYDFNAIEEKWQQVWDRNRLFEPKMDGRKFLLTVPYPYCNGVLHIGHGRTYSTADVFARFKRMMGYDVLYPMAFHISGTPILGFSKKIENGDRGTIDLYRSYLELYGDDPELVSEFARPEKIAEYFSTKIINDFKNLGLSIDWTRQFNSGEPIYNRFVEWQFSKLMKKGYLKQGDYPILFSPKEGNPVGEDDIQDGDTDKVSIIEFTSVFFRSGEEILLASTLRPETLEGVTNLFVNPRARYVRFRMNGSVFVVSEESFEKISFQMEASRIGTVMGSELVGKNAVEPLHNREIPILEGSFVDPDNATGIVYSVPAHSIWDYVALRDIGHSADFIRVIELENEIITMEDVRKKFGINSLSDVDKLEEATKFLYEKEFYHGHIIKGEFEGRAIREAKDEIVNSFINEKKIAIKFYETSRKATSREGGKVIVAIIRNQWFIDYSIPEWKEKVRGLIQRMDLKPEPLKSQLLQVVDWLRERPCARKRGLGTRLPMDREWIVESLSDSTIYTALYPVIRELREIGAERLDDDIFDYVFLGEGNVDLKDGKIATAARKAREEFSFWYPVDLRHTSFPHISNHLIFYLFHHVAIFPERYWPVGISTGGMVIAEGQKMSKSKGNVIPLLKVKREYGADLFRMYLSSSSDIWYDEDWRLAEVENYRKKFERFLQLVTEARSVERKPEDRDMWLVARFNRRLRNARENFNSMKIREASVDLFFNVLNDVRDLEGFAGKERMLSVVKMFADSWALSLAPIIPYLSEEVHSMYGGKMLASASTYPVPGEEFGLTEREWSFVESIINDYRSISRIAAGEHRVMKVNLAEDWKWDLLERYRKEGMKVMKGLDRDGMDYVKSISKKGELTTFVRNEKEVLSRYREDMESFLGIRIEIDGDVPDERRKRSIPGKPALTLQ